MKNKYGINEEQLVFPFVKDTKNKMFYPALVENSNLLFT